MVHRETIKKFINYSIQNKGFERLMQKIKVVSAGHGQMVAEMKVEEEFTNFMGTLHGGFSATLIDNISGYALLTHPKFIETLHTFPNPGVSIDMHISYLRPAKLGENIVISASTLKTGKSLAFLEVEISDKGTGNILVKGSHTKFIA